MTELEYLWIFYKSRSLNPIKPSEVALLRGRIFGLFFANIIIFLEKITQKKPS